MTRGRAFTAVGPVVLAAALLARCGGERATECAPIVGGVAVIANGEEAEAPVAFRLEELWRRAGTREGELLSLPIGVVADAEGRVAIPDFALAEVAVVEPDGTWLGPVTRAGEGPGETRAPVAAAWMPDGVLRVFDIGNSRLVQVRVDGSVAGADMPLDPAFAAPVLARGEMLGVSMQAPASPVILTHSEETRADGTFTDRMRGVVLRLDPAGSRIDTLARPSYPTALAPGWGALQVPGWPRPVAAAADTLLAVAAEDGSYRVLIHDRSGTPVRQICRSIAPLPLSGRELGDAADTIHAAVATAFRAAPRPERQASIGRLVLARDGRLLVQRARPSLLGAAHEQLLGVPGATMDVFDASGRYLGVLEQPRATRIQAVSGDRAWAFEVGELDEVWLVAYRLVSD